MTAAEFLATTLVPGLAWMTTVVGNKPSAGPWQNDARGRLALLAFAGQETGWLNEAQTGGGPGRGPWQVGETTCADVLYNSASEQMVLKLGTAAGVLPTPPTIYAALMAQSATLGVAIPRMILWCDDAPLAAYGNEDACWTAYLRVWRPGAPSGSRWLNVFPQALAADKAWVAGQGKAT
jgi:hypothetical protein